jgi:transcriptional regulator with XRE-family HTH domain
MAIRPVGLTDSFDAVIRAIRDAHGWTQIQLAQRLGVSPKTLGRYTLNNELPPPARRHGMVHALADIDPALLARFARALGVVHDFPQGLPRPTTEIDLAAARTAIEAAVIEAADRVDAGPGRTRLALIMFLERLASAGVDRDTARGLLAAPKVEKKNGG